METNYRTGLRTDKLFNVDVNGARVATGISRDEAETYLNARRAAGTGSCYVYLMERPLETRRQPRYYVSRKPRRQSLRVSAAERQKLTDKLRADGTLRPDEQTFTATAEQVAA